MFIGTSVGMVSATIRPPAAAAAEEADSWCSMRSAARASTVRTFQLSGRCAVTLMAVMRSISSSLKESRHPLVMYSSVVPSCAATSSQKASISRRSAWKELTSRPSPSLCVRDCDEENPRPPAAMDSARSARHGGDLFVRRHFFAVGRTQHLAPQGAVADEEAGVDAEPVLERVEVLAESGPVPRHALFQGDQGHPLDLGHHAADVVRVLGVDGGQGEPAISPDHRRHAVDVRGRRGGIPEQLGVVVRVGVDDPGGHHEPGRVELHRGLLVHMPTAATRPSRIPTSAWTASAPVPSMSVPARMA